MSIEKAVSDHYSQGELANRILSVLDDLIVGDRAPTIDDLAPVDEFHTGGREATSHFLDQLGLDGAYLPLAVAPEATQRLPLPQKPNRGGAAGH